MSRTGNSSPNRNGHKPYSDNKDAHDDEKEETSVEMTSLDDTIMTPPKIATAMEHDDDMEEQTLAIPPRAIPNSTTAISCQSQPLFKIGTLFVLVLTLAAVYLVYTNPNQFGTKGGGFGLFSTRSSSLSSAEGDEYQFTEEEIRDMQHQFGPLPKELRLVDSPIPTQGPSLVPHQFLHLHHMKTGGTSFDNLIRCAIGRLQKEPFQYQVPYTSLHECSPTRYGQCVDGSDIMCRARMNDASVVSFCAPLRDLPTFQWVPQPKNQHQPPPQSPQLPSFQSGVASQKDHDEDETAQQGDPPLHAVTVLRHPVDRVWSMYRFKTKFCYGCRTLAQVYEIIANGTVNQDLAVGTGSISGNVGFAQQCASQLQNHMTRNLILTNGGGGGGSANPYQNETIMIDYDQLLLNHGNHGHLTAQQVEEQRVALVQQAIQDMASFFTIVGLTDDLPATHKMVGKVFPWLAEEMPESDVTCPLPHSNASPENNRCGPDGQSHWELPPHPTAEDAALIEKYNALDMQVYRAAQRLHQLQKVALGIQEETEDIVTVGGGTDEESDASSEDDEENDD
ncbi:hypothetical protein ACA910_017890 [Epithemia clementina (nom. ined.)]